MLKWKGYLYEGVKDFLIFIKTVFVLGLFWNSLICGRIYFLLPNMF